MIHVETLQKTPECVRAFLALPKRLYRKDPYWVPPMRRMEFHHLIGVHNPWRNGPHALFLAYDDERPVARVLAGIDERINERLNQKRGYIALFESENNMEYARAVLDAAIHYLKAKGMKLLIGPMEPGFDDYTEGLLYEGFDSLNSLFNPYNPPYYHTFFTDYGFEKYRDHNAYLLQLKEFPADSYEKLSDMAQKRFGFRVAAADLRPDNQEALARDVAKMVAKGAAQRFRGQPADDRRYAVRTEITAPLYAGGPVRHSVRRRPFGRRRRCVFGLFPPFQNDQRKAVPRRMDYTDLPQGSQCPLLHGIRRP